MFNSDNLVDTKESRLYKYGKSKGASFSITSNFLKVFQLNMTYQHMNGDKWDEAQSAYKNDNNRKIMVDVRQLEELQASGTVKGALHIPKGVIEFRMNNNKDVNEDTSIYVFCAIGIRSALAGYNLKKIGYKNVFNLIGFQDILDQGAEIESVS